MTALASLPMYDEPGYRGHWVRLWALIGGELRAAGYPAPPKLSRPHDLHAHWTDRRLLLSQTCAMPYRLGLWRHLAIVGALDFGLPGCPPGFYRSVIVARTDDPRSADALLAGGRPAVNAPDSQSGRQVLDDLGVATGQAPITGSHAASARAVAAGDADFAAIDAVTWRYLRRRPGATRGLRVAMETRPSPGLPLVTARGRDAAGIGLAVAEALDAAPAELRAALGLRGFAPLPEALYLPPASA